MKAHKTPRLPETRRRPRSEAQLRERMYAGDEQASNVYARRVELVAINGV